MRVLICPAHYLFSDKYGSEPLWAVELVIALSRCVSSLDVIVGVYDSSLNMPTNVRIIPIYSKRSTNALVEFIKHLAFYPLVFLTYLKLRNNNYTVLHHMFPLSLATFNLIPLWLKLFKKKEKFLLGPMQLPQSTADVSDLSIVLTSKKSPFVITVFVNWLYNFVSILSSRLSRLMFQAASCVVFNSSAAQTHFNSFVDVSRKLVIPTGLAIIPKASPQKDFSAVPIKLLCVGRLSWRKGQLELLKVLALISKTFPSIHLTLVGEDGMDGLLHRFVSDNNLSQKVTFVGQVTHDEIWNFYKDHHIFCLFSKSDPSPTVILEAMAYGMPIVASDTGAVTEMVGEAGVFIKPAAITDTASTMLGLLQNRSLLHRMSTKAYDRVATYYTWDIIAAKYMTLYNDLRV